MKLKLLKNILIANKNVALPHYRFKKDSQIETDDTYIIDALLKGHSADAVEVKNKDSQPKEAIVKKDGNPDQREGKKKMLKDVIKNKMMRSHLNK